MIAKSKDNLQLLLTLGYSPKWLGNSVTKTWLPVYVSIITLSIIITALLHYLFVQLAIVDRANLSWFLHWSVWLMAILLLALTLYINSRLVKKELNKIV